MNESVSKYSEHLKQIGIEHRILEHPHLEKSEEVQEHLGESIETAITSLFIKTDNAFVVLLKKGNDQVNLKKFKKLLHVNDLRFATKEEFEENTKLPFGTARVYIEGFQTFIDEGIFSKEYLNGGTGSFEYTFTYKTADVKKIPHARIISVTEAEYKSRDKKRILTGFTPTGKLHLGHYVGNLENLLKLKNEYTTFILMADTHALTTLHMKYHHIRQHTLDVLLDLLSVGLSEDEVIYHVESAIPEIYELSALFSMYVMHNRALRNPTIKDEIKMKKLGDKYSLGFVNYPMFQAADILCVRGDLVPVGIDQEAHLEQSREIARTINIIATTNGYPEIFPEPQALIGRVGKLVGTDGNPKMSKSLGNTIYLSATSDEVKNKVMSMYTDPNRIHATDPGTVEGNPLFIYLDAFGKDEDKTKTAEYKERYQKGTVGDVEVKQFLITVLDKFLAPIRERRAKYNDEKKLLEILHSGTEQTRSEAKNVLMEVKRALHFIY